MEKLPGDGGKDIDWVPIGLLALGAGSIGLSFLTPIPLLAAFCQAAGASCLVMSAIPPLLSRPKDDANTVLPPAGTEHRQVEPLALDRGPDLPQRPWAEAIREARREAAGIER